MTGRRDVLRAGWVRCGPWPRPPFPETASPRPDARHDFDFFHGRWTVGNRRLHERFAGFRKTQLPA